MLRKFLSYSIILFTLLGLGASWDASAAVITGAGSTFSYPIYSKWADSYKKETNIEMNYQAIGSGGGIKLVKEGAVNFGASDVPLSKGALAKDGLTQWPMIMGGVVLSYHIPGIKAGELKLTPQVIAGIFLGKITTWNDAKIQAVNKGVKLPNLPIIPVHRSDGSGTTYIFTNYLGKISSDWAQDIGVAKAISWPSGIGGKGNAGVANLIAQTKGSIGYLEYAYVKQNHLAYALIQNKAGKFVAPNLSTFQDAARGADWDAASKNGFSIMLTDQPSKNAWPITGASFILMHKNVKNKDQALMVLKFFAWSFLHGEKSAKDLDYVAMPHNAYRIILESWKKAFTTGKGEKVWG